jgi:glutamate/tyrosine decarboxylase-like PLP-dependent enzyme
MDGESPAVSAENAKNAANELLERLRLEEVKEGKLQLVTFDSEEYCRFFYPRRALEWQRQVNTYIARALRQQGLRIERISLTPSEYHKWRADREDTSQLRREFADQHVFLIEKEC